MGCSGVQVEVVIMGYTYHNGKSPTLIDKGRKYPYLIVLAESVWYSHYPIHKEKVSWLRKNIGRGNNEWFCNEAGWYYFKDEVDAMAFKLMWG